MSITDHLAKCTRVRDPASRGPFMVAPVSETGRARTVFILLSLGSLMCLLAALGDVVCTWSDASQTYICSGEGSQVVIGGGGPSGGSPVVTNDLGSCTNCSAISPQALALLADDLDAMRDFVFDDAGDILSSCYDLREYLQSKADEIGTFHLVPVGTIGDMRTDATNYMYTVTNAQTDAMKAAWGSLGAISAAQKNTGMAHACNAVYYYANNSVLPTINRSFSALYDIEQRADTIQSVTVPNNGTGAIDGIVADMRAGAVACRNCGDGDGGGDGCGGTNTTMWCTFEQGEAMKSLLSEMSNYLASCSAKLASISNYTYEAWQAIRSGLFTDYTAIPDSSTLGDTWQNVYLAGSETSWGYAPTNILSRIELLLYGISGVGTNENPFASISTNGVFGSFDQSYANLESSLNLTTDWDDTDTKSFGNAVVSFFRAFEVHNEPLYVDTELIPRVNLSEQRRDGTSTQQVIVPSIHVGEESLSAFNSMQSISRAGFSILYAFGSATLVFMFWMGYIHKATKFIKWITMIVQNFLQ